MGSYKLTIPCSFQVREILFSLLVSITVCDLSKEFESHRRNEAVASLTRTAGNLLYLQKEQVQRCEKGSCMSTILIVYQQDMWQTAATLHDAAVNMDSNWLFLTSEISMENIGVGQTVRMLNSHFDELHCIIIVTDSIELAASLIQKICDDIAFKWTRLLHITEWIILSKNLEMYVNLKSTTICIDFMTLVISSGDRVSLARKTRGDNTFKFKLLHSYDAWCVKRLTSFFDFPSTKAKSELKGMHLPIAINFNEIRYTSIVSRGQRSDGKGFSFSSLDLLAEWLGFTYTFVTPKDGGGYGYVKEDGNAIGITGLVARKEAALSVMVMNKISNRLQVNDFLDYPVSFDQLRLIYRLPNRGDHLDTTLADIVRPEFCLILLGPVLAVAFIGTLIHVVTKSCQAAKPSSCRKRDLRRLSSFPSHICFQTEREYVGQPGRILRASWGLFWVILSSAYSAYLVITFTIEPQELKIDSIEQLLETSDYSFGVDVIASSLFTLAQASTTGTLNTLWKRLLVCNKTEPATFSSNRTEQLVRMLHGNFVLICFHRVDDIPFYVADIKEEDYSMVRAYQVESSYNIGPDYISLPKNAFYKETLNKFVLGLDESGILFNLRKKFQLEELSQKSTLTLKLDSKNQVKLSRITLLLYVCLAGVLTATLCLGIEICYCKILKLLKSSSAAKGEY